MSGMRVLFLILWMVSVILGCVLNTNTKSENKYNLGFLFGGMAVAFITVALNA